MRARSAALTAFTTLHRRWLIGACYLCWGDTGSAERAVDLALFEAYEGSPQLDRLAVLGSVIGADPGQREVRPGELELIDSIPRPLPPIVTELQTLSLRPRQAVILADWAELDLPASARVLQAEPKQVLDWLARARAQLEPRPAGRESLAAELRAVVEELDLGPSRSLGYLLARRRRRIWLAFGAAVLAGIVGWAGLGLIDRGSGSDPSPPPTKPATTCDLSVPRCRDDVARAWRQQQAAAVVRQLDPERKHYSGYTYASEERYGLGSWWTGGGGALGFDLYRLQSVSAEVFVQVASSAAYAIPCGQLTGQTCVRQEFMDGNEFSLTEGSSGGMEVQYAPADRQVITVVVRAVPGGELPIDRGQLIALVQDQQLRLPV